MSDPAGKMIEPIKISCRIFVIREIRAKVNVTKFNEFFICSLLSLICKAVLRPFKLLFMNILEIVCDFLFAVIWIPLLVKIHQNEANSACQGSAFWVDVFFPILAMFWIVASLGLLVAYIIHKRSLKSADYLTPEKSKFSGNLT